MSTVEKQNLLDEYAAACRAYCETVERLRLVSKEVEAFIRALDETGTAHRACEQARIKLQKHLSGRSR